MSTNAQITANQQNAQLSTGPVTDAGRQIASKNATKHGFTGQTLVITPQEKEAYDAHVAAYMEAHNVTEHRHRQLVQQLADADWSLHQIFVQQTNFMALMTAIHLQMADANDPIATAKAIAPIARTLNTLSIYEVRRRRAAKSIQEELLALEQEISTPRPAPNSNQPNENATIGSVYSSPAADLPTSPYTLFLEEADAFLTRLENATTPAEAAEVRRQARERGHIL